MVWISKMKNELFFKNDFLFFILKTEWYRLIWSLRAFYFLVDCIPFIFFVIWHLSNSALKTTDLLHSESGISSLNFNGMAINFFPPFFLYSVFCFFFKRSQKNRTKIKKWKYRKERNWTLNYIHIKNIVNENESNSNKIL